MLACMITPRTGEPGGVATVKRPERPRGVWFGGTDTTASAFADRVIRHRPKWPVGSFGTFFILDAVDAGFVCHGFDSRLDSAADGFVRRVYDYVNRTGKWRILAHFGAFREGSVTDRQSQK